MEAVIRLLAATRSPRLGILSRAHLEQWMLEERDSLEFCKSSQVCLKGYLKKVYSDIPEPLCKAEDVSKVWWAYMMKVFWTTNLRDSQLCCLGLIYDSQRLWKLLVKQNCIFLQEGSVWGKKSDHPYLHRLWHNMPIFFCYIHWENQEMTWKIYAVFFFFFPKEKYIQRSEQNYLCDLVHFSTWKIYG